MKNGILLCTLVTFFLYFNIFCAFKSGCMKSFAYRRALKFANVPFISVVEQDVDHGTLRLEYLAVIVPEFHLEKQRHSTVPCVIKR